MTFEAATKPLPRRRHILLVLVLEVAGVGLGVRVAAAPVFVVGLAIRVGGVVVELAAAFQGRRWGGWGGEHECGRRDARSVVVAVVVVVVVVVFVVVVGGGCVSGGGRAW